MLWVVPGGQEHQKRLKILSVILPIKIAQKTVVFFTMDLATKAFDQATTKLFETVKSDIFTTEPNVYTFANALAFLQYYSH